MAEVVPCKGFTVQQWYLSLKPFPSCTQVRPCAVNNYIRLFKRNAAVLEEYTLEITNSRAEGPFQNQSYNN